MDAVDDVYFGFLAVYHGHEKGPIWDKVDIQLTYSRDGRNWQRVGHRQALSCGGPSRGVLLQPNVKQRLREILDQLMGQPPRKR